MLNLYLIEMKKNSGYGDQYDSAVVVAETALRARMIHPSKYGNEYKWEYGKWLDKKGNEATHTGWVKAPETTATLLGPLDPKLKYVAGDCVIASFNGT